MNYISISEASKKWGIPVRTIRYRCETGKIQGAVFEKSSWRLPDNDYRPIAKGGRSLMLALKSEKAKGIKNGLYGKLVVDFTYHSLKIADYSVPYDYIQNLFLGRIISDDPDLLTVDAVVATNNCFKCIDFIIDTATKMLSEKYIRTMYSIISSGLDDYDISLVENVNPELKTLVDVYNQRETYNISNIIVMSYSFNQITPFNRANYMLSKLIVLKECMKSRFVPFVITEDRKKEYWDACEVFMTNTKPLLDEVRFAQNKFKEVLRYFNIEA